MKIKDLTANVSLDIFLLVKEMTEDVTRNNDSYIKFLLSDGENNIHGIMWSTSIKELDEDVRPGKIIKVRAFVRNYKDNLQLNITNCRPVLEKDNVNVGDFVKSAPVDSMAMFDAFIQETENFHNSDLKKIVQKILMDNKDKLVYYPAAKKVHHAIRGGLLYHTYRMFKNAQSIASVYHSYINRELLISGVILHDIGKVRELDSNKLGVVDDYSKEGKLLGHIVEGVIMVHDAAKELQTPEEIELLLKHMIVSHHGLEENGSPKKPMTLEAEILHYLDEMDASVYQFEDTLKGVSKGKFSDKQFFLGNIQLYKNEL
ncbi:MAG TPA: hydrolase [Clostridium sp.]|jgi:3'-5' exoribonuclease|uniref:3'-5' exoribonuclease YhaM family protein n=1 Tax=uncultured Clostridium sp. TaxID=59620 RepID=UPI000E916F20|nr:HD domain-containing protein [uncultured Clostridium sp.]HBC96622.1 hydrolase [Clostridium sp.]